MAEDYVTSQNQLFMVLYDDNNMIKTTSYDVSPAFIRGYRQNKKRMVTL